MKLINVMRFKVVNVILPILSLVATALKLLSRVEIPCPSGKKTAKPLYTWAKNDFNKVKLKIT